MTAFTGDPVDPPDPMHRHDPDAEPSDGTNVGDAPFWQRTPDPVRPVASTASSPRPVEWPVPAPQNIAPPALVRDPPRQRSQWPTILLVATVAAVLGGVVGGLITRTPAQQGATVTILQGSKDPGAQLLSTGSSIPRLVRAVSPAVVSIQVDSGFGSDQGTGMIITHDGLVVTNNHVIAAAQHGGVITVTRTGTSQPMSATLLGTDPTDDVALLQISGGARLPNVVFGNSKQLQVGDAVVAIGNALGLAAGTPTVTQGIVSALGRTVTAGDTISNSTETLHNMIQTDAAINPGNSGGPLLDSNGLVIGMNTAVAGSTGVGTTTQNIGFAIPAARIESLLSSLDHAGPTTPVHPGAYLGVRIQTVTPSRAHNTGVTSGARVLQVVQGFPAAEVGIRAGDVIVAVDHVATASGPAVTRELAKITAGATVPVLVIRGTHHITFSVMTTHWPPG